MRNPHLRPFLRRLAPWAALALPACMTPAPASPGSVPASTGSARGGLECRLEPRPPLVAGGPVGLALALTNRSASALWVLKWNTPLEGWKGTAFAVTFAGRELPYRGPAFKRGEPAREDYVEIPAGGTVDGLVDLAEVYDMSRPGRYRVEVDRELADATADAAAVPRPRAEHRPVPLPCEPVVLQLAPGGHRQDSAP